MLRFVKIFQIVVINKITLLFHNYIDRMFIIDYFCERK